MDPDRPLLLVRGYWEGGPAAMRTESLASDISGLPGVVRVAYARRALLSGSGGGASVDLQLPGQPKLSFYYNSVSPSYFATTGARIIRGRGFSSGDGPNTTPVVMVSEAFVRHFLTGRDPLGAWIHVDGRDRQIIGVVEDGPTIHLKERIDPYLYFAFAQKPEDYLTYFVESTRSPEELTSSIRTRARSADSAFVLTGVNTMRQHMSLARKQDELMAGVTGALALLGLVLAAAGLFGVTSYAVSRRIREFGLRVALGATSANLRRQVIRRAGTQAAIGIPLGWAMAWASREVIQKFLYGVKAGDPWILAAASSLVALVALIAALRPAWTASRVDPMVALRYE
jgi:ABC-type antimicrobial peptide transport system permease subunit